MPAIDSSRAKSAIFASRVSRTLSMDFFLFCLLNAVLFLRPAELVPALVGLPIYQCVLLLTIAASFPQMVKRLAG